jgi:hypothetical protein
MSRQFPVVNTAADTFGVFVTKTNNLINLTNTDVVTTHANNTGDTTYGNGFVIGQFGGTVLSANNIRGGNVSTTTVLTVVSNVNFTSNGSTAVCSQINSTANVYINAANVAANVVSFSVTGNSYLYVTNTNQNTISFTTNGSASNLSVVADGTTLNSNVSILKPLTVQNTAVFSSNVALQGNTTANSLNVAGNTVFNANVTFNATTIHSNVNYRDTGTYIFSSTSQAIVDLFSTSTYRACEYTLQFTDSGTNSYQITKVVVYHDGTSAYSAEYAQMYNNSSLASTVVDVNTGNVRLLVTPSTSTVTLKYTRSLLTV